MNTLLKWFWFLKTLYSPKFTVLSIYSPSGIKDTVCNNVLNMQCTLNKIQHLKELTITIAEVTSGFAVRKCR